MRDTAVDITGTDLFARRPGLRGRAADPGARSFAGSPVRPSAPRRSRRRAFQRKVSPADRPCDPQNARNSARRCRTSRLRRRRRCNSASGNRHRSSDAPARGHHPRRRRDAGRRPARSARASARDRPSRLSSRTKSLPAPFIFVKRSMRVLVNILSRESQASGAQGLHLPVARLCRAGRRSVLRSTRSRLDRVSLTATGLAHALFLLLISVRFVRLAFCCARCRA